MYIYIYIFFKSNHSVNRTDTHQSDSCGESRIYPIGLFDSVIAYSAYGPFSIRFSSKLTQMDLNGKRAYNSQVRWI